MEMDGFMTGSTCYSLLMLPSLVAHQQSSPLRESAELPPLRWRSISETVHATSDTLTTPMPKKRTGVTKRPRATTARKETGSKSSYVLQKEARETLMDQVETLEAQLKELRIRAGLPTAEDTLTLDRCQSVNRDLQEALYQQHLYLGRIHSMTTNELISMPTNPLSSFIHLPREMAQRRRILQSLQDLKLRRGTEIGLSVLGHLDHRSPYVSEDRYIGEDGEYHLHRFEIDQFPNFKTARELYDVFFEFMYQLETTVTEVLGQLTIREETDDDNTKMWNHRIVSVTDDVGCKEELNVVGFAKFYEYSPHTHSPMGVVVFDTVNIDDRYPYAPNERTCRDFQGVDFIYEHRDPGTNKVTVVVKRVTFAVQLVPQFPIAPEALKQLQENASRWPKDVNKFLHQYVVPDDHHLNK